MNSTLHVIYVFNFFFIFLNKTDDQSCARKIMNALTDKIIGSG